MDLPDYPYDIFSVSALSGSDTSQLREHIEKHKPFLARGFANSWPLFRKVSGELPGQDRISLFKDLLGDAKVRFTLSPAEQKGDLGMGEDLKANFSFDDRKTSAHDFLSLVSDLISTPTGECAYAQSLNLVDFPEIYSLVPRLDSIGEPEDLRYSKIWIGSGNHIVDLHYDNAQNFISMIEGVKRITLFPPEALPYIYPAPLHRNVGGVTRSLVKLLKADIEKFPRFKSALNMAQVAILKPGDMLFIPPLWWHCVESYGFNVMINSWYEDNPPPVRKKIAAAREVWGKALLLFSKMDAATAKQLAPLYYSAVFAPEPDPINELLSGYSFPNFLSTRRHVIKRNLVSARESTTTLPHYWRDFIRILYDYYVFREHGNPYPTLPGTLPEVASSFRFRRLRQMWHRTKAGLRHWISR